MAEIPERLFETTIIVVCGTVLLASGDPFGRDLITLSVGIILGREEK